MYYSQLAVSIVVFIFGFWLIKEPEKSISLQISFYSRINWKVEPISMAKEIRNTRIMGAIVCISALITTVYLTIF